MKRKQLDARAVLKQRLMTLWTTGQGQLQCPCKGTRRIDIHTFRPFVTFTLVFFRSRSRPSQHSLALIRVTVDLQEDARFASRLSLLPDAHAVCVCIFVCLSILLSSWMATFDTLLPWRFACSAARRMVCSLFFLAAFRV